MSVNLEAIKAREAAATKGPWTVEYQDDGSSGIYGGDIHGFLYFGFNSPDSAFVCSAREDIPDLVAEVERLRADYDRLNDFEQTQSAKLLARVGEMERQLAAAGVRAELL